MQKLSVFIITKNEEQRLAKTLHAAKNIADEMIVLDSGSTDKTEDITKEHGAHFYFRDFDGFGQQKYAGEQICQYDWVLNIDADEVLSPELQKEIQMFLSNPENTSFYHGGEIPIKSVLPKDIKPRRFARTYDRIRLYNKNKLSFPQHSTFDNIDRKPEYNIYDFKNIILHYSYLSIADLEQKWRIRTHFYFIEEKKGAYLKNLIRLPFEFIWSFIKIYILRKRFLDGIYGIQSSYIYAKYRHIRILQRVLGKSLLEETITS